MRALGILSDKQIIETCLLNLQENKSYIDLFIPSVHDTGAILTQRLALEYIASLTKGKRVEHALEILSDYLYQLQC
jgi:DNA-directed RNA polymerase II subunit RPB2